jgi:ribulose-5-phosphate 4-epimerase/fuculose-1-phosphate aldolase
MSPNKEDIVIFCKELHAKGYTPGASGGLAVLCNFGTNSKSIFVTPEGISSSSLQPSELFVLRDFYGAQEFLPPMERADRSYQISKYCPIFLEGLQSTGAGCIAYITSKWATLATRMGLKAWSRDAEGLPNVIRLSHWGLVDEIKPGSCELVAPVINFDSVDSQAAQFKRVRSIYPETEVVFVRNTGMIVWADTFESLKIKIELLERLCELQVTEFHLVGK